MTGLSAGSGGSWHSPANIPKAGGSGSYHSWKGGWAGMGGSWHQFYSPFTPYTSTYTSGSGSETVPFGAAFVDIMAAGAGGGGQPYDDFDGTPGLGGGGGGTAVRTIAIVGADAGQTLSWNASGDATVSGTLTAGSVSMVGHQGGTPTGGTASGGDTNYTGDNGSGSTGGSAGGPGSGSGGNGGFNPGDGGNPGGNPTVQFAWRAS